jgi:tRNA nucleotidyltransferase (CCA-adding enzyme)
VRDALLGRLAERPDLDFVVPADAVGLCRRLARDHGGSAVVLDGERDIARLVLRGWTLDLARCEGADLDADLARRDYSANALALPVDGESPLHDPTGGRADLARGELVAVSEANLLADPLRLLRGVRLSWELGLPLATTSQGWIARHAERLGDVAGERVLAELERLAGLAEGQEGLAAALAAGLLTPWGARPQPGLPLAQLTAAAARERGFDAGETALALPLARLAALLNGAALHRLRASRRLQQQGQTLLRWAGRLEPCGGDPNGLAEQERLQLQDELAATLPALLLSLPAPIARPALQRWRDPADPLFHPRPPLDGHHLQQALAIAPGPQLGALLQHLRRERAFGRLAADADQVTVLAMARRWLAQRRD